ncbi:hypothetical protein C1M51_00905 [Methylibium sp. Pch-M]|uniref:hypothetical protein n=1 Tax=Methylibium sp. Pch-M TaxID=2082386 RepID=UPI0010120DC2|nr:hypothetical protein [Methylibium sp. Pch-M]QAZ38095.1 hypothetical protein C1M51_00905 [Methylibium sp. Pch-M]
MDYALFSRRPIAVDRLAKELGRFDVFVSAYNSSDRVQKVFDEVKARKKLWLIHPEYQYARIDLPTGLHLVEPNDLDEVSQVDAVLGAIGQPSGISLCVDITGFMRHALVLLLPKLAYLGVSRFTALYSEPDSYAKQEATTFSTTTSGVVRTVRGLYGTPGGGKDHLLIAVGYDHKLISEVAGYKEGVVHPLFAFPSLRADMYQQSALRTERSGEVALRGDWVSNRFFAPANDPFSTAAVIGERVRAIDKRGPNQNVFLAPLSTKAQALGMSLYWHFEGKSRGRCSLLLPECRTYSRETSTGFKRLWRYEVELDI